VLERLRLKVTPIRGAFCCGQVAFNEGMREQAVDLARRFLNSVEPAFRSSYRRAHAPAC